MKPASSTDIKQELKKASAPQLVELCLRLARFKKENKELLTYLLFEADDLEAYLQNAKDEMDGDFAEMNTSHLYFAKKTIRKILRTINKYIRYTGSKTAEVELRLHFCLRLKSSGIKLHKNNALLNLYNGQVKKVKTAIDTLHEDLQYDYLRKLDEVEDV
jgi:hypothetical protein